MLQQPAAGHSCTSGSSRGSKPQHRLKELSTLIAAKGAAGNLATELGKMPSVQIRERVKAAQHT